MAKFREKIWKTISKKHVYLDGDIDILFKEIIDMFPDKKEDEKIFIEDDSYYDDVNYIAILKRLETDEEYSAEKAKFEKAEENKKLAAEKAKITRAKNKLAKELKLDKTMTDPEYLLYLELQKKFE